MAKVTFDPHEVLLAELSPSRRSVFFPVLELLLVTGIIWMGIGFLDSGDFSLPQPQDMWVRRILLLLWVWLAWRRCIKHLIFRSRSRMVLTDQRLITATGHLRSQIAQIPLANIVDARAQGGDVAVYVAGARVPIILHSVPQAKKFVRILQGQIRPL